MAYKFAMGTSSLSGALAPSLDAAYDLGASGAEWKDLYIDGTANIDSLIADTADINGGNIDGTIIGASSTAAGSFAAVEGTTGTYSAGLTATTISGSALVSGAGNAEFLGGSVTAASAVFNGTLSCATSLTLDAVTIDETELGFIDGVSAGTAAASKAVVLSADRDIATIRNLTIDGTFSDGNYTFDTSGNVSGLGTVGCGAITSTGASSYGTLAGGQVSSSAGFISPLAQTSNLGKLNVKGRLTAQGNSMFDGNVRVSGSVTLGNASADVVDSLGAVLGLPNLNATTGSTVKMLAYSALGNVETRTRAEFVADIAGTGLSTSGGKLVLSADTTTVTAFANEAATLVEGFNYASATLTANRVLTLPASGALAVGDVVQVKVAVLDTGIRAIITKAGSQTIDGANEIYLDSSYGAVSLKYVAVNTWRIF